MASPAMAAGPANAGPADAGPADAGPADAAHTPPERTTASILRGIQADRFQWPAPPQPGPAMQLWATYYYVHPAQAQREGRQLQDMAGKAISAPVSPGDFCRGALEGTLRIQQGKTAITYNIAGKAASAALDCAPHVEQKESWVADLGRARFRKAHGPFGDGIALAGFTKTPLALVPFRSIATDARLIAPGSVVYIASARGLKFRDTQGQWRVHDGYFLAADSGPAIQGEHIDIFIGNTRINPFPKLILSEPGTHFEARLIDAPAIRKALLGLHRP